jgi:ribosomal protein L20A (L18A)
LARSAYLLYTMEMRPKVKAENPDLKMTDVVKEMANQWKALRPEEKKKYEDMAAQDKARYEQVKIHLLTQIQR